MKIKEIAEHLHLSVSTVSKALNGGFDVSQETKAMVLEYAQKHGYKAHDERLTLKKMRRLCFLYDNMDSTQASTIVPLSLAFSKYANGANFEVISNSTSAITTTYNQFMKKNHFDGAFIAGLNYKSTLLNQLKDTVYPTVLYDNVLVGNKIANINNENINTIYNLFMKLYQLGHRKIGFIHGDKDSFTSNERFSGYIIGLVTNGIQYNSDYVFFGKFTEQAGYEAADFFAKTDVTAIICSADIIAVGLLRGLQTLNFKVPDDISITGYDDLEFSKYTNPPITTVKQDIDLIGEKALSLLLSMMKNRSSQRIVLRGEILYRNSIGPMQERKRILNKKTD